LTPVRKETNPFLMGKEKKGPNPGSRKGGVLLYVRRFSGEKGGANKRGGKGKDSQALREEACSHVWMVRPRLKTRAAPLSGEGK